MSDYNVIRPSAFEAIPRGTYGTATIDGAEYYVLVRGLAFDGYVMSSERTQVVNKCDCCNRFDVIPEVCQSIAEAIEKKWFVSKEEFEAWIE